MINVVSALTELSTRSGLVVTPAPDTVTEPPVKVKFVPTSFTSISKPRGPALGVTEVSVGAGGLVTVKVTVPVVPLGVVTLTL